MAVRDDVLRFLDWSGGAADAPGFYRGTAPDGSAPGLWVLVLSQVTTWIFARSLMNAAILGYYYGIAGVLAYTAYYASFLTGCAVVLRLRDAGAGSVQDWLGTRFPRTGRPVYNLLVALRLVSEVFANLLVMGLIAAALLPGVPGAATGAMLAMTGIALSYSLRGGLRASLVSDVGQMLLFLVAFALALAALFLHPGFSLGAALTAGGVSGPGNGWTLLAVAGLQILAYPVHDPVMMDRGFLADRATTRASFLHAFWISALCIFGFGLFGIAAALEGAAYEGELLGTWAHMFPAPVFGLLLVALVVSALSTLDSALSSAARLVVWEAGLPQSLGTGRAAMLGFAAAGMALTLWGNQTLFDAVAVSGTGALFLAPILGIALFRGREVAEWAYAGGFVVALAGAAAYLFRTSPVVAAILPDLPKYGQLLVITALVLAICTGLAMLGVRRRSILAGPRHG